MKTKENKNDRKLLETCRKTKKAVEHEGDRDTNWCTWNGHKRLCKTTGGIKNQEEPKPSI